MDYKRLKIPTNKTTPSNVEESNRKLFAARWNVPTAARHCGMTEKEMRMTFFEYCKAHPISYTEPVQLLLPL